MTCTHTLKQGTWVTYEPITKHQPGDWNFPASSHLILVFFAFTQFKPNLLLVPQKVKPRIITWNSYLYPRFIAPPNVTHRLRFTYTSVHSSIFTMTETTQCSSTNDWIGEVKLVSTQQNLISLKKEQKAQTSDNMNGPWEYQARRNKSDPKRQTLWLHASKNVQRYKVHHQRWQKGKRTVVIITPWKYRKSLSEMV